MILFYRVGTEVDVLSRLYRNIDSQRIDVQKEEWWSKSGMVISMRIGNRSWI